MTYRHVSIYPEQLAASCAPDCRTKRGNGVHLWLWTFRSNPNFLSSPLAPQFPPKLLKSSSI